MYSTKTCAEFCNLDGALSYIEEASGSGSIWLKAAEGIRMGRAKETS